MPEALGRLGLVRTWLPQLGREADRVALAIDIASDILRGPAELHERLLEVAALARMDDDRRGIDAGAEQRSNLLAAEDLLEHRFVEGLQDEAVDRVVVHLKAAIARHCLGDVDEHGVRNRVARVANERVDDLLGVVASRARIPQAKWREPVGVNVLRRALELGEGRDRPPAVGGEGVIDLEQERLVALHDERAVRHDESSLVVEQSANNRRCEGSSR